MNIEANELMQGNIVLINGSPSTLTALDIYDVDCEKLIIQPLELSPSLLEKCGFVKDKKLNGYYVIYNRKGEFNGIGHIVVSDEKNVGWVLSVATADQIVCLNKIEYLHQLQNLMTALGTPLKITI